MNLDLLGLGMSGPLVNIFVANGNHTGGRVVMADSTLTTSQTSARSRCTLRKAATPGVCDRNPFDVSVSQCSIPYLVMTETECESEGRGVHSLRTGS